MGAASGALVSATTALEHPGVFGKVGLYSLYMPEPQATTLLEKLEGVKPKEAGEFTLLWSRPAECSRHSSRCERRRILIWWRRRGITLRFG